MFSHLTLVWLGISSSRSTQWLQSQKQNVSPLCYCATQSARGFCSHMLCLDFNKHDNVHSGRTSVRDSYSFSNNSQIKKFLFQVYPLDHKEKRHGGLLAQWLMKCKLTSGEAAQSYTTPPQQCHSGGVQQHQVPGVADNGCSSWSLHIGALANRILQWMHILSCTRKAFVFLCSVMWLGNSNVLNSPFPLFAALNIKLGKLTVTLINDCTTNVYKIVFNRNMHIHKSTKAHSKYNSKTYKWMVFV